MEECFVLYVDVAEEKQQIPLKNQLITTENDYTPKIHAFPPFRGYVNKKSTIQTHAHNENPFLPF